MFILQSLAELYLFCLYTGLFFIVGNLVIGHLGFDTSSHSGSIHGIGHETQAQNVEGEAGNIANGNANTFIGVSDNANNSLFFKFIKFVNPMVWSIFLFWFGATGSILEKIFTPAFGIVILPLALLVAYLAVFIYRQILHFMAVNMTVTTSFNKRDLIGFIGKASINISDKSLGEIVYSYNGQKLSSPAKAKSANDAIKKGDKVMVVDYKDNHYIVEKVNEIADF